MEPLKFHSRAQEKWVAALFEKIRFHYDERLVSLVVYGSYARVENRANSDLDLLVVAEGLGRGRLKRQDDFLAGVEFPVEDLADAAGREGISTEVSSLLLEPGEADRFLPIYLDMVEHRRIIVDRGGFMEGVLERTEARMKRWGSRKKAIGGHWCWEIRPGLKWNEVIDYDE